MENKLQTVKIEKSRELLLLYSLSFKKFHSGSKTYWFYIIKFSISKFTYSDLRGGPDIGLDERVNCTSQGHSIKFRINFIFSVPQISLVDKILLWFVKAKISLELVAWAYKALDSNIKTDPFTFLLNSKEKKSQKAC